MHPLRTFIIALALLFALPAAAEAKGSSKHDILRFVHRQGDKELRDLYRAELAEAKRQGRKVIVMFSADWCAPCKAIKRYLKTSSTVKKAMRHGRMLYIDVDEWRGPAHQLIAGINPTQLPTIVRVNDGGLKVVNCFGSDLGLLSAKAVAANLLRLLDGKMPGKAHYDGDSKLERKLILAEHEEREARLKRLPELEAKVTGRKGRDTLVKLAIRNHEGPRRWYLLPAAFGEPLSDKTVVNAWQSVRFDEHVRAEYLRFHGSPAFVAIAVAGYGSVTLNNWTVWGKPTDGKLQIWSLNELQMDGNKAEFQRKLPYHLDVVDASKTRVSRANGAAKVEFTVKAKMKVVLKK